MALLTTLVTDEGFLLRLQADEMSGTVVPNADGSWQLCLGDSTVPIPRAAFGNVVTDFMKEHWLGMFIEKEISKDAAMQEGPAIATAIAGVFNRLMPAYAAVATRP